MGYGGGVKMQNRRFYANVNHRIMRVLSVKVFVKINFKNFPLPLLHAFITCSNILTFEYQLRKGYYSIRPLFVKGMVCWIHFI